MRITKALFVFAISSVLATAATFTGVITESMCVKDHKAMNLGSDPECARQCVKASNKVKYVLYDGHQSYRLSDQDTPAKLAAAKVRVTGTLYEKTGVIKVDRIEAIQ